MNVNGPQMRLTGLDHGGGSRTGRPQPPDGTLQNDLTISKPVRDGREDGVQFRANPIHHGNDGDKNRGRDESVFYGRSAGLVA